MVSPQNSTSVCRSSRQSYLKAKEIADIDKERWQIELFFKWVK